jgi:hypothetical protein
LPLPGYGVEQGREPSLFHYLQLLRISSFGPGHQDWFLGPDRKEKEDAGLSCWYFWERFLGTGAMRGGSVFTQAANSVIAWLGLDKRMAWACGTEFVLGLSI